MCVCINYTQNKYIYIHYTHTHIYDRAPIFIAVVVACAIPIECFLPKLSCVLSFTQKRDTNGPARHCLLLYISMQNSRKYMYIYDYTIEFSIACNYKLNTFFIHHFLEMQTEKKKKSALKGILRFLLMAN